MKRSQREVQHLFWRAGFGEPLPVIKKAMQLHTEDIVHQLLADSDEFPLFQVVGKTKTIQHTGESTKPVLSNEVLVRTLRKKNRQHLKNLNVMWFEEMCRSKAVLREKMALFWHDHFASRSKTAHYVQQQVNTLRSHALGNFGELLKAISKDTVMLNFLNSRQNKKRKPNENFAREVMELFTLGIGNYTEKDIKEAARAFTGWSCTKKGEFRFKPRQHDAGEKTFLGQTGHWNGEDILTILLEQKQTARFICGKIYQSFVNENKAGKEAETRIEWMTTLFFESNYEISELLYHLFTVDWFYEEGHMGTHIKSPIEFLVGICRGLDVQFKSKNFIISMQTMLGQTLLDPPNVAGWPGGEDWIDSATLMLRLRIPNFLINRRQPKRLPRNRGNETATFKKWKKLTNPETQIDWGSLQESFSKSSNKEHLKLAQEIAQHLLQVPVPPQMLLQEKKKHNTFENIFSNALRLPEYQLC